jgi:hypothetical protein
LRLLGREKGPPEESAQRCHLERKLRCSQYREIAIGDTAFKLCEGGTLQAFSAEPPSERSARREKNRGDQ